MKKMTRIVSHTTGTVDSGQNLRFYPLGNGFD